jgi:hypothetical protein
MATDAQSVEGRCRRKLGYVPRFNPFENEFFWCGLIGGGVLDFFVNSSAFETGGQSENATRILALVVSLGFVLGVDLCGRHKAQGKSVWVPVSTLTGLIVFVTYIRQNAVVAYVKQMQDAVPELRGETPDPWVYVLLFCAVQILFFYIAYHLSVQHYDPLLVEYRDAKMAERRARSYRAELMALDRRLDAKAMDILSAWESMPRLWRQRLMVFIERAEMHREEGQMIFSELSLEIPPAVIWARQRLVDRKSRRLPPAD